MQSHNNSRNNDFSLQCPMLRFAFWVALCATLSACVDSVSAQSGTSAPPSVSEKDDIDTLYRNLCNQYLQQQTSIFTAMETYRETSRDVYDARKRFRELLKGKPESEVFDEFMNSNREDIKPDMRAAYSCWRLLLTHRTNLLDVANWIEAQQTRGYLDDWYNGIKMLEHRRRMERFLDQEELAEIDRLRGQEVASWKPVDRANRILLEKEAAEILKNESTEGK